MKKLITILTLTASLVIYLFIANARWFTTHILEAVIATAFDFCLMVAGVYGLMGKGQFKKAGLVLALLCSCLVASAQTNSSGQTPIPTVQSIAQDILNKLIHNTNVYYATYGLYAPALEKKYGGGIAAMYPLSDYVVAGARVDYVNGGFWMPSGNATLQFPLKVTSWLTVTPFGYAGIGIPLSGAKVGDFSVPGSVKDNSGQPTAILGYGGAIRIYTGKTWDFSLIGDSEKWTGFAGTQYRAGFAFHRKL